MEELQAIIEEYITPNSLFKGTISKPKVKADPLKNIYLTPIQGGDSYKIKAVFRFKTNDQTKIFELDDIKSQLMDWLTRDFNNANLSFAEKDITVLQSKKGKMTILKKSASNLIELESHNRSKNRYIDQEESFLSDLGKTTAMGGSMAIMMNTIPLFGPLLILGGLGYVSLQLYKNDTANKKSKLK